MEKNNFDPNMINLFKEEANKHILKVNNILLSIEKDGVKDESFTEMKREVHTLKGDSRMLGLVKISDASHKLEDLFEVLGKKEKKIESALIENIFKSLDVIQNAVDKLPDEEIDIDIDSIISGKKSENSNSKELKDKMGQYKELDFINLRLKKIDDLINLFSAFPRYINRFGFLLNQLREIKENIANKYHDDEIIKPMEEIISDFSHEITFYELTTKQFQNEITKIKLVKLATIFDLFPRLVRDTSRATGKEVNLVLMGKEVELDKGIVEKLKEILIHILNNAVDHGCEDINTREKLGKSKACNIILSAINKGDNVIIEINDDGSGIDLDKVKQKAIEKGLLKKEKADKISNDEIILFIFEAGFSTKQVSKYSGRGVGMDVVAKTVKELNGDIKVSSVKNKGTTFTLTLPLISFFIPVTIFELEEKILALPSSYVILAIRINKDRIKKIGENQSLIEIENMEISLIDLQTVFDFESEKSHKTNDLKNVLIIKYQDEMAGLVVSNLILENKMVIKKISGIHDKLKIIIGAVLLGSERAIPVLNVPELFKFLKEESINVTKIKKTDEFTKNIWAKNILLVDDSVITRDHEKKILLNQELNVFECSNGKEAIKCLENKKIDIIITDIEMPEMNGIELIKYIKGNEAYNKIPIIAISSYESYKNQVQELGVKHYLNKNNFNAQIFINVLKEENII